MNIDTYIGDLFINATRDKTRFSSSKGLLSIDDLWDLPLNDLDKIAVDLDKCKVNGDRKSFLTNTDTKKDDNQLAIKRSFDIVVYIIGVKQEENAQRVAKSRVDKQREFLIDLKNKKQLEELEGLSTEDIDKRLAELS